MSLFLVRNAVPVRLDMRSKEMGQLRRRIFRAVGRAIADFNLIQEGDRILLGLSGGKDSFTLLDVLSELSQKAPISFSLLVIHVHPGFPDMPTGPMEQFLKENGFAYRIQYHDFTPILEQKLKPDEQRCPLCARFRRGILYRQALQLGCNKIALGHHRDDLVETLLLNLLFSGQLKSMPPFLLSDDGKNQVIRPLAYVEEGNIVEYAKLRGFPILKSTCPYYGDRDNLQRKNLKAQLTLLEQKHPGVKSSILSAMKNVVPSHLLDPKLLGK